MDESMTTITLSKETNRALADLGTANDSREDILKKLIASYKKSSN